MIRFRKSGKWKVESGKLKVKSLKLKVSMRRYWVIGVLIGMMLPFTVVGQEKQNNFEISKSIDIYNSLLRELNLNYVDEINPGELNETAIDAMLKEMDPYTVFIPESEIENYKLNDNDATTSAATAIMIVFMIVLPFALSSMAVIVYNKRKNL